jgi:type I restriction enzyme, S subunit
VAIQDVRLGDVLELERIPAEIDDTTEYVQIGIRSFGRGIFHREPCLADDLGKLRYFQVHPDRLVVSNIMAWEGAVGLSGDAERGCIGSNRFLSYKAVGEVDLGYLNYYFQSVSGRESIRSASTGTVTRNQTLSVKDFENIRVPAPDIEKQQQVAARLDNAFEIAAQIGGLHTRTEALRISIYDAILGKVQERSPLQEGITLEIDEVQVDPLNTYPASGVYGFGKGLIERGSIHGSGTKYRRLHRIHTGMLVVSRLKAFEGALAVAPSIFDGHHVSPEFPTFSALDGKMDLGYLHHLCRWPSFWAILSRESKGVGARRERISIDRLLSTEVPFPSLSEQCRIASQLDHLEASKSLSDGQDKSLVSFKSTLLNEAFAGRP